MHKDKLSQSLVVLRCSFKSLLPLGEILPCELHMMQWANCSLRNSVIHENSFMYDLRKVDYTTCVLFFHFVIIMDNTNWKWK